MRRSIILSVTALAFGAGLASAFLLVNHGETTPRAQIVRPLNPPTKEIARWTQEEASQFKEFALYWVGEELQGLPLIAITRFAAPDALVPEDSVTFLYGTCTPEGEGGCAPPLQIIVEPYCYEQPEMFAEQLREGSLTKIRVNADAQRISDGLRIWTGEVALKIYAESEELETAATQALVSPNGLGPNSSDEPLPSVSADCSDFVTETHPRLR